MKHLGKLQEDVTTVVGQEHERTTSASRKGTLRFGPTILLKETSPICLKTREFFVRERMIMKWIPGEITGPGK